MTVRVGINGFGRIGRNFFRAVARLRASLDIEIVAVNDLTDNDDPGAAAEVRLDPRPARRRRAASDGRRSRSATRSIKAFAERDPANLKWADLGVDVVVESTGFFTDATKARAHVDAAAPRR